MSGAITPTLTSAESTTRGAVQDDDSGWTWGQNSGRLGDGSSTNRSSPLRYGSFSAIVDIDCGDQHTLAIKTDGTALATESNGSGRLPPCQHP